MDGSADRVGLALSGGGFRATLFHLGVLRALRDHDGLLSRVRHIASVSGGSIIAAHVALNWSRYTGTEAQFDEAADELVAFARSDVRGSLIREWLFRHAAILPALLGWKKSRLTALFERKYRSLFGDATLGELAPSRGKSPGLSILATSFTTGQLCAFAPEGVTLDVSRPADTHIATGTIPISMAVAASSAFPPLFPPVPLDRDRLQATQAMYPYTQYLGDGGVYDNLGVRMLALLQASAKTPFDAIVLSDAGAKIDAHVGIRYRFIVSRSIRASDVLMQRVSDLEYDGVGGRFRLQDASVHRIRIDDPVPADAPLAHDPTVQRAVGRLRTDLDEFSKLEVNALVQHGEAVTAHRLGSSSPKLWLPKSTRAEKPEKELVDHLADGAEHRLRVWSSGDLSSWGLAFLLLIATIAIAYGPITARMRAKELAAKEAQLRKTQEKVSASAAKLSASAAKLSASEAKLSEVKVERAEVLGQLILADSGKPRTAGRTTFDRAFADYADRVVRVSFGDFVATGFFVNDKGLLITSNHAVERAAGRPIEVILADGTKHPASVAFLEEGLDLALLQVHDFVSTPFLKLPEERTWREGSAIVVLAFVAGNPVLSANPAVVTAFDHNSIVVEMADPRPLTGGSGGPMITPDGTVVGVYLRTTEAAQPRRRAGTRADEASKVIRYYGRGFD